MPSMGLQVHLVDGTYELFRYHYSPANKDPLRGATRGVVGSCLMLLEQGATHVAVATDHVIESFRNDLWPGYKDGSGVERELRAQFPVVEDALRAAGFPVWAMVEQEADDALAAGAKVAAADDWRRAGGDLHPGQGPRPVRRRQGLAVGPPPGQVVRRGRGARAPRCAAGARSPTCSPSWATPPTASPVCPGGGPSPPPRSSTAGATWRTSRSIPSRGMPGIRSAAKLSATLRDQFDLALLFRRIATVETDAEVGTVAEWRWTGPTDDFAAVVASLGDDRLVERAGKLVGRLG